MRIASWRRRLLASLIDLIVGLFVAVAFFAGGIAWLVLRGRFQRAGEGPDRDAVEPPREWRLSFRHKAILCLATVGFGVLARNWVWGAAYGRLTRGPLRRWEERFRERGEASEEISPGSCLWPLLPNVLWRLLPALWVRQGRTVRDRVARTAVVVEP
jgi:hypothetical protein